MPVLISSDPPAALIAGEASSFSKPAPLPWGRGEGWYPWPGRSERRPLVTIFQWMFQFCSPSSTSPDPPGGGVSSPGTPRSGEQDHHVHRDQDGRPAVIGMLQAGGLGPCCSECHSCGLHPCGQGKSSKKIVCPREGGLPLRPPPFHPRHVTSHNMNLFCIHPSFWWSCCPTRQWYPRVGGRVSQLMTVWVTMPCLPEGGEQFSPT